MIVISRKKKLIFAENIRKLLQLFFKQSIVTSLFISLHSIYIEHFLTKKKPQLITIENSKKLLKEFFDRYKCITKYKRKNKRRNFQYRMKLKFTLVVTWSVHRLSVCKHIFVVLYRITWHKASVWKRNSKFCKQKESPFPNTCIKSADSKIQTRTPTKLGKYSLNNCNTSIFDFALH